MRHNPKLCAITEGFLEEAVALLARWYDGEAPPFSEIECIMASGKLLDDTRLWLLKVAPEMVKAMGEK